MEKTEKEGEQIRRGFKKAKKYGKMRINGKERRKGEREVVNLEGMRNNKAALAPPYRSEKRRNGK